MIYQVVTKVTLMASERFIETRTERYSYLPTLRHSRFPYGPLMSTHEEPDKRLAEKGKTLAKSFPLPFILTC